MSVQGRSLSRVIGSITLSNAVKIVSLHSAEAICKPLKRFYKIEHAFNPELKHGENESFARGSKAYRTLRSLTRTLLAVRVWPQFQD